MAVIVYVETNFLMSVATGRESRGDELLAAASPAVRLAIPSCCYMESFSALEDQRKHRNRFKGEIDRQIGQLRRDVTSGNARSLLSSLQESVIANGRLSNDIQTRLFRFVDRAANILEAIPESPDVIRRAATATLIPDPTDNLILHAILEHAARHSDVDKVSLTENTRDFDTPEVHEALLAAGIRRSFGSVASLLGWLGSLPS